jgi:hexaprenyl-diphosphate synthase
MDANAWEKSIRDSESLVNPSGESIINPKKLLGDDISLIRENISRLLGSGHPVLNTISHYYFSQAGKHIRPLIVLLMAHALHTSKKTSLPPLPIDSGFESPSDTIVFSTPTQGDPSSVILPSQKRLAEITEMIHTASLLHDDVIDSSLTRRSKPSANAEYGNKLAILAGDFLLARASLALARLRNVQVVELLATVISNLVEGEFMQLRQGKAKTSSSDSQEGSVSCAHLWTDPHDDAWNQRFEYYMEKTYMKTASLIAKSCEATAVLGGCSTEIVQASYGYGHHLGLAFQVRIVLLFLLNKISFM